MGYPLAAQGGGASSGLSASTSIVMRMSRTSHQGGTRLVTCTTSTVQHARNADFRCIVVRECVAGTSHERHEAALLCLGHVFAYVASLADVDAALRRAPALAAARSLPTHDLPPP